MHRHQPLKTMCTLKQQLSTFLLILCLAVVSTSGFGPQNWNRKIRSSPIRDEIQIRGNTLLHALPSKKKKLKTFQRYLEIECWKQSNIRDLEPVLQAVAESCKQINRIIQRAQTDDLFGAATDKDGAQLEENVQGEVQQTLDVLCNKFMLRAFCGSGNCIQMVVSEEEDEAKSCADVMADSAFAVGDYIAAFDPIDGSKNIDSSLPLGSIFAIYKKQPGSKVDTSTFYQDGTGMVAAGYCLFSASTVLVLTMGAGVDGFTLDPDSGRFLHTLNDIRIPRKGSIYSFNEANYRDFEEPVQRYLDSVKQGSSTARYIGALVADVHNILINGGLYGYPGTRKNPDGKLRLLYECAPMAMIMEQAGGAGSTGTGRVLALKATEIHQRTPVFLGSVENVFELDQFYSYYGDENKDE
ncbi:unnamed protein product [Cylindrotheca closterium]|uniref:Fructose-1,6-bisphosphatase, cytosolic n=1 Tax=Cylindrotheca closterium TaxID=2856 RepID=A0AAD2FEK7_9STRA|nr:unnamed protein product [Cylindrotheca closterium]